MRWAQLRTILWLRWRLTRNQWSRRGGLDAAITMLAVALGGAVGVLGGLGGLAAGALALAKTPPEAMLGVWDAIVLAFLFFWMIGIVSDIQRSETVDVGRMLHLPISLKGIFLINYLVSHFNLIIILFVPGMVGLALGLTLGKGVSMIWLLPLVLGCIFMITAWTYYLRGWLVTLMVNKRRRRAVIAGITMTFILVCQLPNLFMHVVHDRDRPRSEVNAPPRPDAPTTTEPEAPNKREIPQMILLAHKVVPFLWVGNGALSLAQGNLWPAVLGAAGAFGLGALGLGRAYRATVRFYQGLATGGRTARRRKRPKPVVARRSHFVEKTVPGVPPEAGALALASLRSLTRATEVKMALATNFIMLLFFGGMVLFKRSASVSDGIKPFIAAGAVTFMFFGMSTLMFNQFGFDRAGFRTFVLSPAPRERILLGKNLGILPIVVGTGSILLVLARWAVGIPWLVVLAASLQLGSAFFLLSMVGNLMSVLVPYRIAPGSLKPTKVPAVTTLCIVLSHMLFPTAVAPIFLPALSGLLCAQARWLPAAPVNVVLSAAMLVLLAFLYRLTLPGLGRLLQRRETKVLDVVTQEIE